MDENTDDARQISKLDFITMDTARKKLKKDLLTVVQAPPPPAVARRNARERNRVKQVNNGFANLRQHIPNHIAAAYESGRGGNKKLSKVETLRMAVDYIKSLEEILGEGTSSTSSDDDVSTSSISTPPPHFIKIEPDGFRIVPMQMIDDNIMLKTEMYSDSSLSPGVESELESFAVFNVAELAPSVPIKREVTTNSANEELRILCRNLIMLQADAEADLGKQPLNMNELMTW